MIDIKIVIMPFVILLIYSCKRDFQDDAIDFNELNMEARNNTKIVDFMYPFPFPEFKTNVEVYWTYNDEKYTGNVIAYWDENKRFKKFTCLMEDGKLIGSWFLYGLQGNVIANYSDGIYKRYDKDNNILINFPIHMISPSQMSFNDFSQLNTLPSSNDGFIDMAKVFLNYQDYKFRFKDKDLFSINQNRLLVLNPSSDTIINTYVVNDTIIAWAKCNSGVYYGKFMLESGKSLKDNFNLNYSANYNYESKRIFDFEVGKAYYKKFTSNEGVITHELIKSNDKNYSFSLKTEEGLDEFFFEKKSNKKIIMMYDYNGNLSSQEYYSNQLEYTKEYDTDGTVSYGEIIRYNRNKDIISEEVIKDGKRYSYTTF